MKNTFCIALWSGLIALVAACEVADVPKASSSPDPRHVERTRSFGDWSVFTRDALSGRLCWVATTPTSKPSRLAGRQITIIVKTQPKEFSIVSDTAKFRNEYGSLVIGDKRYQMFFRGKNGWAHGWMDDFYIVQSLASAPYNRIEVGGEFFAFSGAGFAEAFADANALCAE